MPAERGLAVDNVKTVAVYGVDEPYIADFLRLPSEKSQDGEREYNYRKHGQRIARNLNKKFHFYSLIISQPKNAPENSARRARANERLSVIEKLPNSKGILPNLICENAANNFRIKSVDNSINVLLSFLRVTSFTRRITHTFYF